MACQSYNEERYELHQGGEFTVERNYGTINQENREQELQVILQEDEDSDQGLVMHGGVSELCTNEDISTFFRDGRRKIDFVLVYEENSAGRGGSVTSGWSSASLGSAGVDVGVGAGHNGPSDKRSTKHDMWRYRFMESLRRVGLDMEEEVVESSNKKLVYFIKLHATWPVLCHYAEELNMRAPLQAHPNPSMNWSEMILQILRLPNIMYEEVPNKPLDYYTCPFRKSKMDRFLGSENHDTYFGNVQRSRILYEILSTAIFGKKKKGEVGIDRLVEEGVFSSAFPLHDGPYEMKRKKGCIESPLNPRQVLYEYWARWGKWYKYQPLDHIRDYFGEKIAIYFAWLGFYTGWLLPAAIVGLLVFLYGVFTMHSNQLAIEVCDSRGQFKMCPLCDETIGCNYWDLSDVCGYARVAYLFDHPGTVFYAVFVSFWAVTFLEYWKRKSASLAHHWDCMGFQEEEERPRPEFAAKAPFLERNPVTGVREPSFPSSLRHKRVAAGIGIIFLMMSLVIIFIVAVIIYRVLVSIPLFQHSTFRAQAQAIANVTGAVVNLCLIMAMSRVYEKLAYRLTTWAINVNQFAHSAPAPVISSVRKWYKFMNKREDVDVEMRKKKEIVCSAGGCLIELAQQLAVIMIGKQIINNAQEILVPKLKAWWHKKRVSYNKFHYASTKILLQFGFITIFVAAFPLAPLFALLNNWVEIRLDAQKFVCETRRIVAERAENIGIWFKILDMLAHLAVISNYEYDWDLVGYVNFTLAYAPPGKMIEECRYRGLRDRAGNHTPFFWRLLAVRLAFVIVFEHVVFGICRLIDVLVPDIPESLELKIKRERYLAKQALQDSDTIMKVASRKDDDYEDLIANGGMVLDLTAELGSLVHGSTVPPPISLADIKNNTSTESQATNQTEASVNTAVTIPRPDRQKGSRPLSEHATSKEGS
uniref:Anoctamin n=1 Tax=Timema monikensis TaxID=170555 RepID=A0A7R9E014_9NEOP|nr:unnamed protein product [Timema monikensis]